MSTQTDDLPIDAQDSLPLLEAIREYGDQGLLADFAALRQELRQDGKWHYLGTPQKIEGYVLSPTDGYGHTLLEELRAVYRKIEQDFTLKLQAGALVSWGREGSPLAPIRRVPGSAWSVLRPNTNGTATHRQLVLFDVRVAPAQSVASISPTPPIEEPAAPTDVGVAKGSPQSMAHTVPIPSIPPKGRPGRPSPKEIVLKEHERRRKNGECESSIAREARALLAWFEATYPTENLAFSTVRGYLGSQGGKSENAGN